MRVPFDPELIVAALPDLPRWVETRSLLLSGAGVLKIAPGGDGAVVMDPQFPSGSVIGRADIAFLRDVFEDVPDDFELIVQMEALEPAKRALPGWVVAEVIVHSPARPYTGDAHSEPGVAVSAPPGEGWLEQLPNDVRMYAAAAEAVAVRVLEEEFVAVCAAGHVTETLWDVGVDTIEGHRRRGHATACFHVLADWMAARGRQPVWAAYENYPPSLKLAEKLGFRPVDRIAVLSPPSTNALP